MLIRSRTVAVLLACGAAVASAEEGGEITLGVGMNKSITVPGMTKVGLGNPAVADVQNLRNDQLLITGKDEGRTSLLILKSNGQKVQYRITVQRKDVGETISEVKRLMGEIEGVTIKSVGDRLVLDGQAYTQADADRIAQIAGLYPNLVNFVKVASNAKKLVAQNLNVAYQKAGLKNVQANVVGSTIFLEGSVESPQDLQKADMITKALGEKAENLLSVGIKRMILSEVSFVEIRRESKDRYGIKYPLDISGTTTATISINKDLFPGNFAEGVLNNQNTGRSSFNVGFQNNDGYGRLLAQPKLVCASGEQAEFLAGGEVPIPLITNNQFAVEFKPYGVILRIKPTADRTGNIQTNIEAEVSEVDQSVAVSAGSSASIPGFRSRKVKTNVTVRHGETIVLSNVFSHDEQKSVSKVPGIGHIPIIGELFKNRAFDANKRDLVIFVTPRIVNPDSDRVQKIISDIKSRYEQARGEVNFGIFD